MNKMRAVMAARKAAKGLDFAPTHPWATRTICEWLRDVAGEDLHNQTCLEPACGEGHMVRPLREYFRLVRGTDIKDYGHGFKVRNFISGRVMRADWIFTNPPFSANGPEKFMLRALQGARCGVVIFGRTGLLEGITRYRDIWQQHPPTDVLQFVERVPLLMGRLDPTSGTATAYCALVWRKRHMDGETRLRWLPPDSRRLKHAGDYQ